VTTAAAVAAAAAAHSSCQQHGGGVFPEPADTRRVVGIYARVYKVLLVYEITTAAVAVAETRCADI